MVVSYGFCYHMNILDLNVLGLLLVVSCGL